MNDRPCPWIPARDTEGDSTDAVLLTFEALFGFKPHNAFTSIVTRANGILNNPTSQTIVNTNLQSLNAFVDCMTPIAQVTVTPSL